VATADELMIEFELCLGLIFKPLRHHLQLILDAGNVGDVLTVWKSILAVLEELKEQEVSSPEQRALPKQLKATMDNLTNEHLHNAVKLFLVAGVFSSESISPDDKSSLHRLNISDDMINAWQEEAANQPPEEAANQPPEEAANQPQAANQPPEEAANQPSEETASPSHSPEQAAQPLESPAV
jgi:pyruvate/2-oxoglutarate dehydrogenase complex dihydrolipoamide acyltransferase (E2) component